MMVAPGDVVLLGDFGYQPTSGSTISDVVFIDANADGIQDANEPGISGVTVQLTNDSDEIIATTTTDENGNYIFGGLPACLLYTSPSPRDLSTSRMPSSA